MGGASAQCQRISFGEAHLPTSDHVHKPDADVSVQISCRATCLGVGVGNSTEPGGANCSTDLPASGKAVCTSPPFVAELSARVARNRCRIRVQGTLDA